MLVDAVLLLLVFPAANLTRGMTLLRYPKSSPSCLRELLVRRRRSVSVVDDADDNEDDVMVEEEEVGGDDDVDVGDDTEEGVSEGGGMIASAEYNICGAGGLVSSLRCAR